MIALCPYCMAPAELVDTSVIYNGKSYGMAYLCRPCWAYVGCHKNTTTPKGRLANSSLRRIKVAAHAAFDPIWKTGNMNRADAYKWLAKRMNIKPADCHIGFFNDEQCEQVIRISNGI